MTQPDELKPKRHPRSLKCPECGGCLYTCPCDVIVPAEDTRSTPDLSRILKLAAVTTRWYQWLNSDAKYNCNTEFDYETAKEKAYNALTPEDHQLLEAALKE